MFTADVQYAILIIKEVREKTNFEPVTMQGLSDRYGLKLEFLFKIARKLRIAGYIKAVRGPGGGYLAARDLSEIKYWILYRDLHPSHELKLVSNSKKAQQQITRLHEEMRLLLYQFKI